MSLNILLMSDEMIKERSALHGNVDPKLLYGDIKISQDKYILPIIGTALYEKLQARVNANDWTGYTDYKTLLDNYIVDALMYFTLARMPMSLSYQLWNKGVVRKQGENTDLPSMSELVDISNRYSDDAQYYANRLRLYLIQQSSVNSKFPEYLQPGTGIDTVIPDQKSFTMPIYLGDDDHNPWCNPGGFTPKPYSE